jgi:hypothetical protein
VDAIIRINPRSGVDATTGFGSNDGHPEHDMALTEQFLAEIYNAVRASPQYNEVQYGSSIFSTTTNDFFSFSLLNTDGIDCDV